MLHCNFVLCVLVTSVNEAELFASSVFLLLPLGLITVSYSYIVAAVLRIRSPEGKSKAFNTCPSYFMVVSLFYGSAISSYLQSPSNYSRDQDKMISLFYTFATTMLNPLICTLRNKEIQKAIQKIIKIKNKEDQ